MRIGMVLVLVAIAPGCIESELIDCGNGIACPIGAACDLAHRSCTTTALLAACEGVDENAPCTAPGLTNGACHDGVCLAIACGNMLLDPGELCDDGNEQPGDGCAADCRSNESCGNGLVDLIGGEQCDDGNLTSHDGCSSACRPENPEWRHWQQLPPPAFSEGAYAYDTARRRLVVFGGKGPVGDTLEWDGSAWFKLTPVLAPAARRIASAAYDSEHQVVVLFGGMDTAQQYGDTWLWDGSQWRDVTPAQSPPPRQYASMAYDSKRKRVVLFGGVEDSSPAADTWEWDGATWTERTPAQSPPEIFGAPMSYDPIRGAVVLVAAGETWTWDGTIWTHGPPVPDADTFNAGIAFDPLRGCTVLAGSSPLTQCWDGTTWTQVASDGHDQNTAAVWFDDIAGAVVEWGGFDAGQPSSLAWKLDPQGTWSAFTTDPGPIGYVYGTLAYDPARARTVLFGAETWDSAGASWRLRADSTNRPTFLGLETRVVYDEKRGRLVVVNDPTQVYEYDGQTWTTITPVDFSPTIGSFGLVYDVSLGKVVLFGGEDVNNVALDTTWTWDGTDWTDVSTTGSVRPIARLDPGVVYDVRRREVVMFGGHNGGQGNTYYGDTWVWTSAAGWSPRQSPNAPAKRRAAAMTYDPMRGEIMLFGGSARYTDFGDLWHWNGSTWSQVAVAGGPGIGSLPSIVYDNAREQLMLFSGDTWVLQWVSESVDDNCELAIDRDLDGLAGCADPDCWGICTPTCPPLVCP